MHQNYQQPESENQWRQIFRVGAVATLLVLVGIIADLAIGTALGGNLTELPATAIDRFAEFQQDPLRALYNLDLLNVVNQLLLVPGFFALYAAHRNSPGHGLASLGFVLFLLGTVVFVTNNVALSMFELSVKFFAATTESQKILYAAAGEAHLARGAHGSTAAFLGFVLPNLGGMVMSLAMLRGAVFSRSNAYLGLSGSVLIVVYITGVTFIAPVKAMATLVAAPGGLLLTAWMIVFVIRLFRLARDSRTEESAGR